MAEVEEEMLHMDEEVNGEPAEVEHMDELNEDLEKDLDGIAIEVVEGNKPGSRWLIAICHEQKVFLKHDVIHCMEMRGLQRIQTTYQDRHNKGGK